MVEAAIINVTAVWCELKGRVSTGIRKSPTEPGICAGIDRIVMVGLRQLLSLANSD